MQPCRCPGHGNTNQGVEGCNRLGKLLGPTLNANAAPTALPSPPRRPTCSNAADTAPARDILTAVAARPKVVPATPRMFPVWALFWLARLAMAVMHQMAAAIPIDPNIESKLQAFKR